MGMMQSSSATFQVLCLILSPSTVGLIVRGETSLQMTILVIVQQASNFLIFGYFHVSIVSTGSHTQELDIGFGFLIELITDCNLMVHRSHAI